MSKKIPQHHQDLVDSIWKTYYGGGPYAHNIITMDLKKLSGWDRELADEVYEALKEEGF